MFFQKKHKQYIKKCVTVPCWHLTAETLDDYINTGTYTLPIGVYGGFSSDHTYAIHICRNRRVKSYDTPYDYEPHLPKDLLALLNWSIQHKINTLLLEDNNTEIYKDWDDLQEHAKITGLPLYDIEEDDFDACI